MNYYQLNTHLDLMFINKENMIDLEHTLEFDQAIYQSMLKDVFDMDDVMWVKKISLPSLLFDQCYSAISSNVNERCYLIKINNNGIVFLATKEELLLNVEKVEYLR